MARICPAQVTDPVKAPASRTQSKRFAQFGAASRSRSVWSAASLLPLCAANSVHCPRQSAGKPDARLPISGQAVQTLRAVRTRLGFSVPASQGKPHHPEKAEVFPANSLSQPLQALPHFRNVDHEHHAIFSALGQKPAIRTEGLDPGEGQPIGAEADGIGRAGEI